MILGRRRGEPARACAGARVAWTLALHVTSPVHTPSRCLMSRRYRSCEMPAGKWDVLARSIRLDHVSFEMGSAAGGGCVGTGR